MKHRLNLMPASTDLVEKSRFGQEYLFNTKAEPHLAEFLGDNEDLE